MAGSEGERSLRLFTWEEIGQRNGRGSAAQERWLVIERKVYDISKFYRRHPGGSRVISHYAGQDATVSGGAAARWPLPVRGGTGEGCWGQGQKCGPLWKRRVPGD